MKIQEKLFFISFFLFFACENRENTNLVHRITKWENGNIRDEGYYVNDSIKEGLFRKHYRSGKLESEISYHNNKKNGPNINYFENGKEEMVIFYKDDMPAGHGEGYHESGALKWYQAYDLDGESRFEIDFFEDGKMNKVMGCPVVDTIFNHKNFSVGDTLKVSFVVAVPKNSKVKFHLYESFGNERAEHELVVNELEGSAKFEKVINKKGIIKWGGIYVIKLDNGKNIGYPHEEELIVE